MDLRLFPPLLRVAELQNFTKAAELTRLFSGYCHSSDSPAGASTGDPAFERIGKRVRMTEHGEQFIPYAIEILKG